MDRLPRQREYRIALPIIFIKQRFHSPRHCTRILLPAPSVLLHQGTEAGGGVGEREGDGDDRECCVLVSGNLSTRR